MVEHKPNGPIDWLNFAFSRVAMWGAAGIVAIMFYEVVMRYVFFQPTLWVNEMSLWVAGGVYVTAGLYSMQQRSHIRIAVLYDIAPRWLRHVFDFISALCIAIFALAVIWGGYGEALAKLGRWETFGTAWDPPIPATNKALILVTVFILMLQGFSNFIRDWPVGARIRKTFDVLVGILVIGLCLWAFPALLGNESIPVIWQINIAVLLSVAMLCCIWGWWHDFNTTPEPVTESPDPITEVAKEMRGK